MPSDQAHKATFYLTPGTFDALEDIRQTLINRISLEHQTMIPRSLLVDLAIRKIASKLEHMSAEETLYLVGLGPRPDDEKQ